MAIENKNIRDDFSSKENKVSPLNLSSLPLHNHASTSALSKEFELDELRKHVEIGFKALKNYSDTHPTNDKVVINDFIDNIATGTSISSTTPETLQVIEKVADECLTNQEWESAYGVFTLLILSKPTNANYWFQKSLAMHYKGEFKIALSSINVALILEPSQPEFHLLKSAECLIIKDNDQALASLQKAKELITKTGQVLHPDWIKWQNILENQLLTKNKS
ncbi:MAG: hypothetical protein WC222_10070 [Parachlamydiales bacterium]|jgi:tetratricopeptide (TPR) repeat protein